jgi:ketosteroid isomerase-like protein
MNMPDLEQRLRRMEDIEAIRTLKSTYHLLVNDTMFDEIGDLFTERATVHLGYLMPGGATASGRTQIQEGFAAMATNQSQSQVKQFLHTHIVDLVDQATANGTGMLFACYGVGTESYVVAGKYVEEYEKHDNNWLFSSMRLELYFTVPLQSGWAGARRHYLVNSGQHIPDLDTLLPNPAIK